MSSALSLVLGRPFSWRAYLALAAVPILLSPLLLTSQWGQSAVTAAIGCAAAVACVGRWRTGRGVPRAWAWIAAGLALNATGSLLEAVETQVFALASPSPGVADVLYLSLYPCLSIGLLQLVRARHPQVGSARLLDAGALSVGLGLLCWVFLIRPSMSGASGSALAQALAIAYPVGDLMLLAILARVLAADGWRTPSVLLICLGLCCFLLGDSAWALVNNNSWATTNFEDTLLGIPFLIAYSLVAAAALHGSVPELDTPVPDDEGRMSRMLLVSLGLSSLVAPAVLAAQSLQGQVHDGVAIAICWGLMTSLAIVRVWQLVRQVQNQSAELRELALEDALTGLPNRRALQAYLSEAMARARRDEHPLSLALFDLDHFKRFNDELGHAAGDQLLRSAAAAWTAEIRETDMLARIGGEEFVLVLPEAGCAQATAVVAQLQLVTPLGQTLSAGIAGWDTRALADELLAQADAAMYEAKRAGRDRIMTARAAAVQLAGADS
jgi:diguanylate cyclase (GGDEF)-like protein